MNIRKLCALLLCFLLFFGCDSRDTPPSTSTMNTPLAEDAMVYVCSTVDYQADCLSFTSAWTAEEALFLLGIEFDGTIKLFRSSLSGGACTLLASYTGSETVSRSLDIAPWEDTIWTLVGKYDHESHYTSFTLEKLDAEGNILSTFELAQLGEENFIDIAVDGEYLYLLGKEQLYLLNLVDQSLQHTLGRPGSSTSVATSILPLPEGRLGLVTDGTAGIAIYPLSSEKMGFDEALNPDVQATGRFYGDSASGILYSGLNGLYRITADGSLQHLFDWETNYLLFYDVRQVLPLTDGRIAVLAAGEKRLYLFTPVAASSVTPMPEKEVLTLAYIQEDYDIAYAVSEFNKTHTDCEIQLLSYQDAYGSQNSADAVARLNTDILAGNAPDLLAMQGLPYTQYAATGLLVDLYPYLDADTDYGRDTLLPGVMRALDVNGGIYQLCASFQAVTAFASRALFGDVPGWTPGEREALLTTNQPLFTERLESVFSSSVGPVCLMDYVDWAHMSCSFDSESFVSLLRALSTQGWTNDVDEGLLQPNSPFTLSIYLEDVFAYGEDFLIKGLPVEEGSGTQLLVRAGVAMTTSCKNRDAAWDFLRILLSEDYQKTKTGISALSTNAEVFQFYCDRALSTLPEGADLERAETLLQMLRDAIADNNGILETNSPVLQIIEEEAAAFFAGTRNAEETAKLIQQRVSVYLAEQS